VVIEGVGIRPGDYIHADGSGAVAIPASEVDSVIEGALAVVEEDAGYIDEIKYERPGHSPRDRR